MSFITALISAASLMSACLCDSTMSANYTALRGASLLELQQRANQNQLIELGKRTSGCTLENVIIRKEWNSLTAEQRINYTNSVLCLQSRPAITPESVAPGVRNRYDDFVATHINQTITIHFTSIFFAWHRYFLHTYEQALANECGYSGAQPYWNWSDHADNPLKNALFDGSTTSLGGDGAYIPHNASYLWVPVVNRNMTIPGGTGSGCIYNGPFQNMTVNLGPGASLNYNPRCLTRDFHSFISNTGLTYDNITALIADSNDLATFTNTVNANSGVHSAGHNTIGGQMLDVFGSVSDPAFFFHHAQLDHVWNTWQWLDAVNRINQVAGTLTFMNIPPSANGTLSTPVNLGYNAGTVMTQDIVSTIDGPFCYIYE